jgi:putative SOS response-associated peptidase YedK
MCGRYASSRKPEDLVEEFGIEQVAVAEPLAPSYNVAPTDPVYAVFDRFPRDPETGERADVARRRLSTVSWGLVPSWAKERSIGSRMINARVETIAQKPAFKRAFARRRCLLPADGYFEWYPTEQTGRNGKPAKQPFFIRPKDGGVLAMAGLYEIWRNPEVAADDDEGSFLWTCAVITTRAEDDLGHLHDRMPMLVEAERYDDWLDASAIEGDDLLDLLVPAAPGRLEAVPVSTAVNDVRHQGPDLIEPIPLEPSAHPPAQPSAGRSGEPAALFDV